jgi:hypothetical protein
MGDPTSRGASPMGDPTNVGANPSRRASPNLGANPSRRASPYRASPNRGVRLRMLMHVGLQQ